MSADPLVSLNTAETIALAGIVVSLVVLVPVLLGIARRFGESTQKLKSVIAGLDKALDRMDKHSEQLDELAIAYGAMEGFKESQKLHNEDVTRQLGGLQASLHAITLAVERGAKKR